VAVALDSQTDDDLLVRLQAGDEVAFQALVDRHRAWLVRLCTRLLGHDAHAAEDAAQESLLKLHAAARQGRPLRVRPWLTVVARNTCVDEQRRRRPDLPGELPERAVPSDDPFELDVALADAWSRLSGRHREVLYLREVLGFSYKEIGRVMGLSMAATETLVFRARTALRREYERSGGSSFSGVLLGLQLSRLGVDRRREAAVPDGLSNVAMHDPGISGLTSRLSHFLSASLPGCGEQAMAKVLSVAAGVMMAAASMTAGLGPFGDAPSAGASAAPRVRAAAGQTELMSLVTVAGAPDGRPAPVEPTKPKTLKALLGDAVPADWAPQQSRAAATAVAPTRSPAGENSPRQAAATPLRAVVEAARSADRPELQGPGSGSEPGPLRSILASRPDGVERPERPRPIRTLLDDPTPLPLDPLPLDVPPVEPVPATELEVRPSVRETAEPLVATFAGDERTPLRLRDRERPREGVPQAGHGSAPPAGPGGARPRPR
jgi:RNA polymerase sigma-70 factor, ECF subfamily